MRTEQHATDTNLLGTEEQVRQAAHAARKLVAGCHLHTHELVVWLRNLIRQALDLEPIPTRPGGGGADSSERYKAKGRGVK